jgi:epoxyqueuosine reductase
MDYLSLDTQPLKILKSPDKAYISRYSLGRDYHKLMRQRLAKLAKKIDDACQGHQYRAFVDSAPVLERAFAQKSGLGWFGKNTMIINRKAGSWFFLGEIYTTLPLPISEPYETEHCGKCRACLDICPTQAFTGPYQLDSRKCISYLTIEYKGSIPVELREKMGNRIFGCDDCQLICPWNRFAKATQEQDFSPRHHLEQADLIELFNWDETTFLKRTEGSAIRRAGYESWLRNIAIGLGNAHGSDAIINALKQRLDDPSSIVREHVQWAYQRQLGAQK